jgi:hypothetical protein
MQRYSFVNYTHTQILSGIETFQEYIGWKMGECFVRSSAHEKQ